MTNLTNKTLNQPSVALNPTETRNESQALIENFSIYFVLGLFLLGYGIFCLNGPGNDDDTYRMISTWLTLVKEHYYVPSRCQGYLIPELVIGFTTQIGGYYLANLVSAVLAISTLFIFYLLLSRITKPLIALLAVITIGSNPFWIIAATTSMDYIYGAFFFALGCFFLVNSRIRIAGLIFALAISSRITYGPMVLLAFGCYFLYIKQQPKLRKRVYQGISLFFISCILLYLPVFIVSGMNLSFLRIEDGSTGGLLGTIVRFVYKNIYYWGLPTFIVLLILLFKDRGNFLKQIFKNPLTNNSVNNLVFHVVFWSFVYTEMLFLKLPHEYNYLLPILFCVTYFITTRLKFNAVKALSIIFALNIVYCVIANFDFLDTYQTVGIGKTIHADGARVNLSIKPGILVREFEWRGIYQKYQTDEFNKNWQNAGFKLEQIR